MVETNPLSNETESDDSVNPEGSFRSEGPAITVEQLSKSYSDTQAVDDVSFQIERGTVVGLLGPNGAGKTTTIKCLLGLVVPSSGTIQVGDVDVRSNPKRAYRRIGATLEGSRNAYWRLTVLENMGFFSALAGNDPRNQREYHRNLLSTFDIEDKADTVVRELSRGQKQKVSLACALAREAAFLFLDEPTLGLDVESSLELQAELRRLAEDNETTVLISSHDMDVVEDICDRVIIMNEGHIIEDDSVENLLNIFNTQRYEVTVLGTLSRQFRNRLRSSYSADSFTSETGRTRFKASVTSDEFYRFIETVREANVQIASIDTIDSDLEYVFLEATENADRSASGEPVGTEELRRAGNSGGKQ